MPDADRQPIVSVCLAAFAGADRAATNLSLTTGLSRHLTLSSPHPDSPEVDFTIAHLRERRPAWVIFNGWSAVYARIVAALCRQRIGFAVHWHSGAGQTDLAGEWPALTQVIGDRRIGRVLFASESLFEALAMPAARACHLPNTLPPAAWEDALATPRPSRSGRAQITLFAQLAESARKNVTGCLLALVGLRRRVRLHLNGLSREPRYRRLLDVLRIPYREWGWMTPERYAAVVRRATMGLQVSFAETYGYVAAEHLVRAVPVVGSTAVPVLARLSTPLRRRLVVVNPDSPGEIRERLRFLLDHSRQAAAIGARARAELQRLNRRDIARATRVLRELLAVDRPARP